MLLKLPISFFSGKYVYVHSLFSLFSRYTSHFNQHMKKTFSLINYFVGLVVATLLLSFSKYKVNAQGINFDKYPNSRWPNNQVPYVIISYDNYTSSEIAIIAEFNNQVRCVKFVPRSGFFSHE